MSHKKTLHFVIDCLFYFLSDFYSFSVSENTNERSTVYILNGLMMSTASHFMSWNCTLYSYVLKLNMSSSADTVLIRNLRECLKTDKKNFPAVIVKDERWTTFCQSYKQALWMHARKQLVTVVLNCNEHCCSCSFVMFRVMLTLSH